MVRITHPGSIVLTSRVGETKNTNNKNQEDDMWKYILFFLLAAVVLLQPYVVTVW